ncbi:MAG: tetratricopeptide repeat protein [Chitinispirillaceae bacterium]|nr:tetratricopeptide repeat protein [Chitinispirillaceae bacterium]
MSSEKGLSVPVVVVSGVLLALLSLIVFLSFQLIATRFSPTVSNADRYLRMGKLDEAFALSERVPGESVAKELLRGKIFLALALKRQKDDGWRHYGTDSSDWLRGAKVDSALACFRRAAKRDKESAEAQYFLGVVFKEKGWFHESEDALHEALRLDSGNIDARLALGALYPLMDRSPEAVEHLLDAYQRAPGKPQIAKNLALLYRFHTENPESAIIWFNRYLNSAAPGDIGVNQARMEITDLLDRYPELAPEERQQWRENRRTFVPRKR